MVNSDPHIHLPFDKETVKRFATYCNGITSLQMSIKKNTFEEWTEMFRLADYTANKPLQKALTAALSKCLERLLPCGRGSRAQYEDFFNDFRDIIDGYDGTSQPPRRGEHAGCESAIKTLARFHVFAQTHKIVPVLSEVVAHLAKFDKHKSLVAKALLKSCVQTVSNSSQCCTNKDFDEP